MLLMNGLSGGLGEYPPGPPEDPCKYDPDWQGCMQRLSSAPATNNQSTNVPWWQALVTGVTQGAVTGLIGNDTPTAPLPGQPGYIPPYVAPPPAPWYTTTTGMVGLGAGALVLFLLLRK